MTYIALQLAGLSQCSSTRCSGHCGQQPRIEKITEFEKTLACFEQTLHSRTNLLNSNIRIQNLDSQCEVFTMKSLSALKLSQKVLRSQISVLQCCMLKFYIKTGQLGILLRYLIFGWVLTSWFMFCCQFLGSKYLLSS